MSVANSVAAFISKDVIMIIIIIKNCMNESYWGISTRYPTGKSSTHHFQGIVLHSDVQLPPFVGRASQSLEFRLKDRAKYLLSAISLQLYHFQGAPHMI